MENLGKKFHVVSLPLPRSYPEPCGKIVSAAPKLSARCKPAALLLSTNTASQQGSHPGLFLTSTQDASSVSADTPIAPASPASSREGAGSQLNPGFGTSRCLKCNTQLVQQYTAVRHMPCCLSALPSGKGKPKPGATSLRA